MSYPVFPSMPFDRAQLGVLALSGPLRPVQQLLLSREYIVEVVPLAAYGRLKYRTLAGGSLVGGYGGLLKEYPLLALSFSLATSFYLQSVLASILATLPSVSSLGQLRANAEHFLALSTGDKIGVCKAKAWDCFKGTCEAEAWLMAAYGALVAAPVKHFLPKIVDVLQSCMPHALLKTQRRRSLVRLMLSYGVQTPVEVGMWLLSMSWISGSRTSVQLKTALRSGFGSVFKAAVFVQTLTLLVAQRVGKPKTDKWAGILQFITGLVGMTMAKRKTRLSRGDSGGSSTSTGRAFPGFGFPSSGSYSLSGAERSGGKRAECADWQVGCEYKEGERVKFRGREWSVQQDHKAESDWTPDTTPNLFAEVETEGESKGAVEDE